MRLLALLLIAAVVTLGGASSVSAQPSDPAAVAERRAAIAQLAFLEGNFSGEGWMIGRDRVRRTFQHVERSETRMDGLVLTFEGAGAGPEDAPGAPSFRAFGVISWDSEADKYELQTYAFGDSYPADIALIGPGTLQWAFSPAPEIAIRYVIDGTQAGTWREVGHVSTDGGATWSQFFEMNLTRQP